MRLKSLQILFTFYRRKNYKDFWLTHFSRNIAEYGMFVHRQINTKWIYCIQLKLIHIYTSSCTVHRVHQFCYNAVTGMLKKSISLTNKPRLMSPLSDMFFSSNHVKFKVYTSSAPMLYIVPWSVHEPPRRRTSRDICWWAHCPTCSSRSWPRARCIARGIVPLKYSRYCAPFGFGHVFS